MLSIETALTFFAAALLLGLAPGPDNLFVLTQSALYGRRAGLTILGGLCTGLVVHTQAVALGVAAIFRTSALAFTSLKLAGAGYLVYLAWQAFRAGGQSVPGTGGAPLSLRQLYARGIVMNVTNPKVSLFFLAFLPQFADPSRGPVMVQLLLLGGLFIVATLTVFSAIALAAGSLGEALKRSLRIQRSLNRVSGLVFLGLALRLATAHR